ncbi:MAG: ATP-binding protein [Turicibacter sp.]|nr:ATP-binding protein [Turicibacter sp.]
MNNLQIASFSELTPTQQLEIQLDIVDESIRRRDLARLTEMEIDPIINLPPLETDIIESVRLYKITEMVYEKGESVTDKFTTVFNTLSTYTASVFVIIDSNGLKTDFYLGVRSNGDDRSTVTLGDTLKNTLIGHFPGVKIDNADRAKISALSQNISKRRNVASVSVIANSKGSQTEKFAQGIEKLALAMSGRQYTGIIIAQNQSAADVQLLRKNYQKLYTQLSPLQSAQMQTSGSISEGKNLSFFEMSGKQKTAMIGSAILGVTGAAAGFALGNVPGLMLGGQIGNTIGGLFGSLSPNTQKTAAESTATTTTAVNKTVADMLELIDESLKRTSEFDSYGMWNVAGYFISDDMSAAEIAASNYRSLMNGENSGREISAINSWRSDFLNFGHLTTYLSRFIHPLFIYGGDLRTSAATSVSGKELGLHLGLPRATVPGLPVIEHAEFGKEVNVNSLKKSLDSPEDKVTLGKIFDLGQVTKKNVELDIKSLNMHTFITGSTGSGKSNTVYQILTELYEGKIPFLVIEPAKGEYKDVFGHLPDVNVFSTNPNIAPLINLNPFKFPQSIHILEHVDGLVEIFSVCWPMYDAMPAFFKDAILRSYEVVGWDLGSSDFDGNVPEYPDFEILSAQLEYLINNSGYHSDIKSNYKGALLTRVRSLMVGLNKFIFTNNQTPYEEIFDQNCLLDISRVKSGETKALIMGLVVYILNEYLVDRKSASNRGLRHITVLEEAHNLLKNTAAGTSELVGKSVEILTNTIAEIRTYGEGFIIVDQSPSSVDIAAIKNTNTKIVLRTPEANDREAVGRSMGLTADQVNEIAKLPSGVAVVYQNDWISPVLSKINKANICEKPFVSDFPTVIKPIKTAKSELISMLMQPWIEHKRLAKSELLSAVEVLEISRNIRKMLFQLIKDYDLCEGQLMWAERDLPQLQKILRAVLGLSDGEFDGFITAGDPELLRQFVSDRTKNLSHENLTEICHILTCEVA